MCLGFRQCLGLLGDRPHLQDVSGMLSFDLSSPPSTLWYLYIRGPLAGDGIQAQELLAPV